MGQSVQIVAPGLAYVPAGHTSHTFVPEVPLNLPTGHKVQAGEPASAAVPALQMVQVGLPLLEYLPMGQSVHVCAAGALVFPAAHSIHSPAVRDW